MPNLRNDCLGEKFLASANVYGDRQALFVDGTFYTYQDLLAKAFALAELICRTDQR